VLVLWRLGQGLPLCENGGEQISEAYPRPAAGDALVEYEKLLPSRLGESFAQIQELVVAARE